jgi:hypothetical protein
MPTIAASIAALIVGDGSKVNWDNLHGKISEDVGPYKIGRLFKDPEF